MLSGDTRAVVEASAEVRSQHLDHGPGELAASTAYRGTPRPATQQQDGGRRLEATCKATPVQRGHAPNELKEGEHRGKSEAVFPFRVIS